LKLLAFWTSFACSQNELSFFFFKLVHFAVPFQRKNPEEKYRGKVSATFSVPGLNSLWNLVSWKKYP
jgi:hypothetical protein